MSRTLCHLLDQDDALFPVHLSKLEQMAGKPGTDVRLMADILGMNRLKLTALGLDPDDTTGAELYAALKAKVFESDEAIQAYLGHPSSSDEAAKKIDALVRTVIKKPELWCVKSSVMKSLLKKNPPKRVMKLFKFQSVDSLNKRMDTAEVIFAARIVESKTWWTKQKKLLEALVSKDFEKADLKVIYLSDARWLPIMAEWESIKGHSVITSAECGAVGYTLNGGAVQYMLSVPIILHACNEVILHGAYLKLHYVNPSLGQALVHAIDEGSMIYSSVSGVRFHWRDVQRYFGNNPEMVQVDYAHLDIQDLGWMHIETQLSILIPDLAFWVGTDYLGVTYGRNKNISLNMHDLAMSVHLGLDHKTMFLSKMQRALKSELMARYLHTPVARALVIKQFDISGIAEENW